MEKSSSKTIKWSNKMDQYYSNVSKEQLINDLSKSGFKVTKKK